MNLAFYCCGNGNGKREALRLKKYVLSLENMLQLLMFIAKATGVLWNKQLYLNTVSHLF